jgi:hypothetical protein
MLSKQTPSVFSFHYNPFTGASVNFFPRGSGCTRSFDLQPVHPFSNVAKTIELQPGETAAIACGGLVILRCTAARQIIATVNGKTTERFSVVYPSKRRKQTFASY